LGGDIKKEGVSMKAIKFNRMLATTVAGLMFASASIAFAADEAGTVLGIKGDVVAKSGDASRTLLKDDPIYVGDTLVTGDNSYIVITFIDGAKASVRPNSELEIARYSQSESDNGALINLVKGGLRAVTGAIAHKDPESYKVKTPVATLGVRGTEYYLRICEEDCVDEQKLYVQNMVEQNAF
jgi:hypothetical protein